MQRKVFGQIYTKKSVDVKSEVFICSLWGLLQHVSAQWDHLHVIHTSRITKKMYWVMGGVQIDDI